MDASNPVMTSDRKTVEEILETSVVRRRQDMSYLGVVARSSPRHKLPTVEVYPRQEVARVVEQFKSTIPVINPVKEGDLDPTLFEVVMESMPVCGILDATGIPLHPPGKNQTGGYVTVNRQLGSRPGVPMGLAQIASVMGDSVLNRTHVYTSGTWSGFKNRINQQMGRKTVSLLQTMKLGTKAVTWKAALDVLDRLMPRDPNPKWPGLHSDIADAVLGEIQVTANASAGAPYWRNKGECMEQIIDVGLPLIVDAIKSNSLPKLWKENPELFLCEVKNKLDRYEIDKLDTKTRPYTCIPAHWAFLFSMLTQGFQETLHLFNKQGGCNAYGFSSSNGGLDSMVDWMRSATKRGKFCCYGDDTCLVVRRHDGVWRVDPDFKQMDGSIDEQDVELTIRWVLRHLKKDGGLEKTPHFWKAVADMWKTMATRPFFILDGKKIYRKRKAGGLMTGIPGTTLFDTVKSVLAWNSYLDFCEMYGEDPLNKDIAVHKMAEWGLIIKEGTWNPARIPESRHGQLITDHKFLGVQIMALEWNSRVVHVPTIPEDEALQMLVVQKDNPFEKLSRTAQQRRLFDRMRGLMITCGFSIPNIELCINAVVNSLPGEVIIMQTQNPTGEKPDHITLQDFSYPDSSGFPTKDFCMNLYAGEKKGEWVQIYPNLEDILKDLKGERKQLGKQLRFALKGVEGGGKVVVAVPPPPPRDLDPVLQEAVAFTPAEMPQGPINPRSKVERVKSVAERIPEPRTPTRGEAILRYLRDVGGVCSVGTLSAHFGVGSNVLSHEATKVGFFMTGTLMSDLVTLDPLVTPLPTYQDHIVTVLEEKRNLIDKGAETRKAALDKVGTDEVVRTAPEMLVLSVPALSDLHQLQPAANDEEALRKLHVGVTGKFACMTWKTMPVRPQHPNPVGVQLLVKDTLVGDWYLVAEAWSANKRMAQGYIARSIMELNGLIPPQSELTVFPAPPAFEMEDPSSWADITKFDEQQEKRLAYAASDNPRKPPPVRDLSGLMTIAPPEIQEAFSDEDPLVLNLLYLAALLNHPEAPGTALVRMLARRSASTRSTTPENTSSGSDSGMAESPSKRSQRSLGWRKRQNERLHQKRKGRALSRA